MKILLDPDPTKRTGEMVAIGSILAAVRQATPIGSFDKWVLGIWEMVLSDIGNEAISSNYEMRNMLQEFQIDWERICNERLCKECEHTYEKHDHIDGNCTEVVMEHWCGDCPPFCEISDVTCDCQGFVD
jgi:hypothetical protein